MAHVKKLRNVVLESSNTKNKNRTEILKRTIKKGRTHKLKIYMKMKLKKRYRELFGDDEFPEDMKNSEELGEDILRFIDLIIKSSVSDENNTYPVDIDVKDIYDFTFDLYSKIPQLVEHFKEMALILNFQLIEFKCRQVTLAHCEKQKQTLHCLEIYEEEKLKARRKFIEQRKERGSKFVKHFLTVVGACGGEKALMPIFVEVLKEEAHLSKNEINKQRYIKKCRRLIYGMLKENNCIFHRYEYFFCRMEDDTFKELMEKAFCFSWACTSAIMSPTPQSLSPEPSWNIKESSSACDDGRPVVFRYEPGHNKQDKKSGSG